MLCEERDDLEIISIHRLEKKNSFTDAVIERIADEDHIVPQVHRLRLDQLAARMPDEVNARHREGSRVRIAQGKATQRRPVPAGEGRGPRADIAEKFTTGCFVQPSPWVVQAKGSDTTSVAPIPGGDSARTSPFMASTNSRTMASPSPDPDSLSAGVERAT